MSEAYHHGDLRNALIETGLRWLDERGELPSLRQLAAACQVSHAAPYRHFADADELRGAIAARCFDDLHDAIAAAIADGEQDLLERGVRAYVGWGVAHPARYSLMFGLKSPVPAHPGCQQAAGRAFQLLVNAAAREGVAQPERVARALWAAQHGVVELIRHHLLPVDPSQAKAAEALLVDDLVQMSLAFLRGAGPGAG